MNTFKPIATYSLALACASIAVLFQLFGDEGLIALRYRRDAIVAGELWRLITAHLIHLNWAHLVGNLLGLTVTWLLVGKALTTPVTLLVLLGAAIGCDLGLWLFHPELIWYVGLSGVLHGLLLAGAFALAHREKLVGFAIAALVALKLIWEQLVGPLPGSEAMIENNVIVSAHLYGAFGGLAAMLIHQLLSNPCGGGRSDTQRTS